MALANILLYTYIIVMGTRPFYYCHSGEDDLRVPRALPTEALKSPGEISGGGERQILGFYQRSYK